MGYNIYMCMNQKSKKRKKKQLFRRDGNKCYYCNKSLSHKTATIDHLIPKTIKEINNVSNLVLSCETCNKKKGSKVYSYIWKKLKDNGFRYNDFLKWALIKL